MHVDMKACPLYFCCTQSLDKLSSETHLMKRANLLQLDEVGHLRRVLLRINVLRRPTRVSNLDHSRHTS